jgi:hypothetical protein
MTKRRRGLGGIIVALALFAGATVCLTGCHGAIGRPNSLWVWGQLPPQTLMTVASRHRVGRLLVWVSPGFSQDSGTTSWLLDLHAAATQSGVALDALGGDPTWARSPDTAARWSSEVAASGWFERLHLDIEPYALADWTASSTELVDGTIEALRDAAKNGLPVDADVPYWFQMFRTTDGRDALTAVCEAVASITVMAYQDEASAIERVAQPAVAAGARSGIPVWIGVNLRKPVDDAPSSSLWGADESVINTTLAAVSRVQGIAGIALHDADAVVALDSGRR